MADIDRIIDVTIERRTAIPTVASFDIPLIAAEFLLTDVTPNMIATERVRLYSSLTDIGTAFGTTSEVYLAARKIFNQTQTVSQVAVGRKKTGGDGSETWTEALDAILADNNTWYALIALTRTESEQEDVADWVETNDRITVIASGDSDIIDSTGDIAEYLDTNNYDRSAVMYHPDSNANNFANVVFDADFVTLNSIAVTINTELTTIVFDTDQDTTMAKIKSEIEANANLAGVSVELTDTAGNNRTFTVYYLGATLTVTAVVTLGASQPVATITYSNVDEYPEAAWIGKMLPKDPGSATWAFQTLSLITSYALTSTQITTVEGKNGNFYTEVAGIDVTQFGTVGSGEYLDVIRGIDWMKARIQELVFTPLVNLDKVSFTNNGIEIVNSQLKAALQEGVEVGLFSEFETSVPDVADVPDADKANRLLPDVEFTAILAGAIHKVQVNGVVSL